MAPGDRETTGTRDDSGAPCVTKPFEELFAEHYRPVRNFARRMTGDDEAAEDIAQETFIAAYESHGTFRGESGVRTWLFGIAKNLCLRRYRDGRRKSFDSFEKIIETHASAQSPFGMDDAERVLYADEVKNGCLSGLLICLPFMRRCAFILNVLLRVSIRDTAEILERSENSVRILVHRARADLRIFLCRNCSRLAPGKKCACENMIAFSLERNLIGNYHPGLTPAAIETELRTFRDEIELYRSLPVFTGTVKTILRGEKFLIFSETVK